MLEWPACYWLVDYWQGELPPLDPNKKLFVFASHGHPDHYNPGVLHMGNDTKHVLSSDIKVTGSRNTLSVEPESSYRLSDGTGGTIDVVTLKSTDLGVAFLLRYMEKTIYHGGDLHLWVWEEATEQENEDMIEAFNEQMDKLKGVTLDVAFAPLDPRLGKHAFRGMDTLISTARVKRVFPMHFGDDFSIIEEYKQYRGRKPPDTTIMEISYKGQQWEFDI